MREKQIYYMSIPGIDLLEVKRAEITDLFLTVYYLRSHQGDNRMDMIMFNKGEALALLDFLKENEQAIRGMK